LLAERGIMVSYELSGDAEGEASMCWSR
jgi:hypothetical protein